ncbi:uncharacterized protein K02A2.6-like [Amyelois transitella]|uniref:uncharacterized protein K02A2.6-like n=2 Tax=Amyelois transitella TaxID=680683 RepID=UPI00067AF9CA|nr:uncharacterized protein K02A2.6-like [Amyelois transitella]XP_013200411.1 uncharacterized protein K02A2.6-like [Amyelois transitella]XP_060801601.1 uncharacterized protein K02A2.6-like [Amyelois transitella]XP_060801926.1 uncharacterized protein K02A2.6-like [Amyelois transitella]XP_060805208.1 uncharacterized protein K02A2.6-like [Amyelois transitella]
MEHARPPSELCLEGGPANRADAWRKWYKQFLVFLKASGVYKEPTDVQASLLINLIGSEGYDVYTTFKFEKETDRENFDKLVSKFNEHFGTKQNTTMARFKFFTRNQENGESVDEYVTALKILSQHCEFEHLEEGLIRDRVVCGVTDGKIRDRLLRAEDLTLARAVKICQASEMSTEEKRQIEGTKAVTDGGASSAAVDVVYGGAGGPSRAARGGWGRPRPRGQLRAAGARGAATAGGRRGAASRSACRACMKDQCDGDYKCAARNAQCFWCSERGHFKSACPKLKSRVYQIEEELSTDDSDLYYVSTVDNFGDGMDSHKWYETLFLYGSDLKERFKLDTGSDLNVMSLKTYCKLGLNLSELTSDNTRALSFCGNFIPIVGSCYINWFYKNKVYKLRFIISEHDCQNVLGKFSCEQLGLIKRLYSIDINQYDDIFKGLGKLPGKYKIVTIPGAQPSVCPVRKIPVGVRDKLRIELDRMENLGVIRRVTHPTPWVNAIVVAAKKDGSIRVCLDPRPLNRAVRRAHYPLPTLTDIATKLEGARYFSKLDARSGFWMVQLDDDSADLCTFGTPYGRYQYLRLPYGINCASEVFHQKIRQILEGLEGVDSFVDDVIVWGSSISEHDERLKLLLNRARDAGIKFNKEKCEFCVQTVTYLGHTFSSKGMQIDESKLKAIRDMPNPQDRSSLERFLGMVNYLSKFIPHYSEIAAPLRILLKKDSVWNWDEVHEATVRRLKESVCAAPVLALYSAREPVLLSVDASSRALGAVLMQGGRPVEYASSTLTDTQCRYAQIEKELLAIVFALERFHQYVYGRKDVTVETDHKPLETLFHKALDSVPARLQRMMLRIQGYDFKVTYKPGKYMFVADTLSRAPLPEQLQQKVSDEISEQSCFLIENVRFSDSKLSMIKEHTMKDEECQLIIRYIKNGWPNYKYEVDERVKEQWSYKESFEYVDGIIFKDNLVYIPFKLRYEMVKRVHDGHMGIDRCKRHARDVMFWPGMSRDIESAVRRCATCAERVARPAREPLLPHPIPSLPWAKIGSDIFQNGNKYFLILVDYFSNYIEVCPLLNITSKTVITAMKDQFARHGIPQELITDNGPAYASKEFATFSKQWGFKHVTSSPKYPVSNGRSEKAVHIVKNMLTKSLSSGSDFYLGLLNLRTTPRDGISSPSQLLMGRRLNSRLPSHDCKLQPSRDNRDDYKAITSKQARDKQHYDKRARALPELRAGQRVVMVDAGDRKHARVQARAPQPRSYFVIDSTGKRYRRNRRHLINVEAALSSPSQYTPEEQEHYEEEDWSMAESEDNADDPTFVLTSGDGSRLSEDSRGDILKGRLDRARRPAAEAARTIIAKLNREK